VTRLDLKISSMDPSKPILVGLHPLPTSAATSLLRQCQKRKAAAGLNDYPESDLLRSIKATLHGSDPPRGSETSTIHSLHYEDETSLETELTWDAYTVVLSCGGVIRKKWDFSQGNQRIQWACIGHLNQPTSIFSISSTSPARYTSDLHSGPPPIKDSSTRETFGPFSSIQQEQLKEVEAASRPKGTFVFFRNIGKVFLSNGIEYTFNLPFVTRRAWPAHPHGVVIQRVFDPSELEEARISGDPPLPTLFSFTNPFAEVAAVGVSSRILGGFGSRSIILEHPPSLTGSQEQVPPQEIVIWVSQRGNISQDDLAITLDPDVHTMKLWRYVYVDPDGEKPKPGKDNDDNMGSTISAGSELEVERLRPCFWFEKLVCFDVPQTE
jgi:anaphase-promoting complex subunit 1